MTQNLTNGALNKSSAKLGKTTLAGSAIGALAGGFASDEGFGNTLVGTMTGSSLGGSLGLAAGAVGLAAMSKYKVGRMTKAMT